MGMRPAAQAFEAAASTFDARFSEWQSVAAQRTAVRDAVLGTFPPGGTILEIGGGTGEDAVWLAQRGFKVLCTDAAPTMVETARRKLAPLGSHAEVIAAEDLERFSSRFAHATKHRFDGAFSNFAGLNCVDDLRPVARGLARLLRPGGAAVLVLFGKFTPGEMVVECLRGRPRRALRRFSREAVPARVGGHDFTVRYHEPRAITLALHPWFTLTARAGIGIFVPPSAAEPWISRHPRFLKLLHRLDRMAAQPLAPLGDHVLYKFQRTEIAA